MDKHKNIDENLRKNEDAAKNKNLENSDENKNIKKKISAIFIKLMKRL